MSDHAQFIVLCEDLQAQVFIRRVLLRGGVEGRRIRTQPLPSAAADAYVVKEYPAQVKAFRARNARASYGLVVHVDADPHHGVAERHAQLAQGLVDLKIAPRGKDEPIAELVPKRNIETWIYALDDKLHPTRGEAIDETGSYPKLQCQSECDSAAGVFADYVRQRTTPAIAAAIPSLHDGLEEFGRLPKWQ